MIVLDTDALIEILDKDFADLNPSAASTTYVTGRLLPLTL